MDQKQKALECIDRESKTLCALSDALWDHPETKYKEFFAARTICDLLKDEGFDVEEKLTGIPTAFCASYGSGSPVIGILAEFDALEGLSQQAECDEKCPVESGAAGHGCGHNLFAAGSVGAALAVRDYLREGHEGTVKLFGCPAEEGGSGKTFMARDGAFDGLDVAFAWHPGDTNNVSYGSNLANIQVAYRFTGKASHAAISPENGRSALDAVMLMGMGTEFLREHISDDCRIHYSITDSGGTSPNTVPASAEVLYLMRAPMLDQVRDLNRRVNDIAGGAAMMTETSVEIKFIKACSNILPNRVLSEIMQKNLEEIGSASYNDEDRKLAEKMRATMDRMDDYYCELADNLGDDALRDKFMAEYGKPLYENVLPFPASEFTSMASSDVGDVSWICPVAQISMLTMPAGTSMHSWQEVAVGKSSMAKKGMLQAAKVIAASVIDTFEDPEIIVKAKEEKECRTNGENYICPIPQGVRPPM